jgi:phosphatidyl-myo-inositol dimannoside synthase
MQRVATELHESLSRHPDVDLQTLVLRSSWKWTHMRTLPFLARTLWTVGQKAERGEIDAVLFSSMVSATLAIGLRRKLAANGVASATIVHGKDVTLPVDIYQKSVPHTFRALDAVLPVSHATAAECIARGLAPHKLLVVPNGVKLSRFGDLKPREAMRAELENALGIPGRPVPKDGLLLCSVGRQIPRKGFAWFIDEVMPLLPEEVHYWIAGEGPEHDNNRAAIERRGLSHRVRLLGRINDDELHKLYRGADLFMMPNIPVPGDMEGFGVVMLEAALGGLPTVAARLEGIRDVIVEGHNGHLVNSGHAWAFSEAIMQYYRQPEMLEAASHRALHHTIKTFGWNAVANKYVTAMRTLVPSLIPQKAAVMQKVLVG